MRTALRVAALLASTGCLFKPAMVPQSFSIDPPAPRSTSSPDGVVLALTRVEVAPPYSGQSFVYRTGEHGLGRDPYARFAAPPGWLPAVAIRGYLERRLRPRRRRAGYGQRPAGHIEIAMGKLAGEASDGSSAADAG
jgi:hypothetical protein